METSLETIRANYNEIMGNIGKAAVKSGRKISDIKLVAVTKTVDAERIKQLLSLGVKDIGENKAQELLAKYGDVSGAYSPAWHFIGHLQRNKVRQVVGKVSLIHSLDSFALAEELEKQSAAQNAVTDALIELNIANEPNKYGVKPEEAADFAAGLTDLPHIRLRGLMCVAPDSPNAEDNRIYFKKMFQLLLDTRPENPHNGNITFLSMGMTGDYVTAIEEGANIIRVGTGLFGNRKY